MSTKKLGTPEWLREWAQAPWIPGKNDAEGLLAAAAEIERLRELAEIGAMRVEQETLRVKPDRWMEMNQRIREAVEAYHIARPKGEAP